MLRIILLPFYISLKEQKESCLGFWLLGGPTVVRQAAKFAHCSDPNVKRK